MDFYIRTCVTATKCIIFCLTFLPPITKKILDTCIFEGLGYCFALDSQIQTQILNIFKNYLSHSLVWLQNVLWAVFTQLAILFRESPAWTLYFKICITKCFILLLVQYFKALDIRKKTISENQLKCSQIKICCTRQKAQLQHDIINQDPPAAYRVLPSQSLFTRFFHQLDYSSFFFF